MKRIILGMTDMGIRHYILLGFLLLIPTQLGKHWWFDWSKVMGVRVDYLSLIVYAIDCWWLLGVILREIKISWGKWEWIMLMVAGLNTVFSNRWEVAIMNWCRWFEWWWLVKNLINFKDLNRLLGMVIPWWIGIETGLGLTQISLNRSLQGIFYWLGERKVELGGLGVAEMTINSERWMRAYGTFSHPNSMAGFLLVSMLIGWKLIKNKKIKWLTWWMGVVGLLITGSRITLAMLMVIIVLKWWKIWATNLGRKMVIVGVMLIIAGVAGGYDYGGWDKESWSKRLSLNIKAVEVIKANPLLGIGNGNWTTIDNLKWRQPVHNVFLLKLAELGMLGIALLGMAIRSLRIKSNNWWIWLVIGVTAMFDHYWVTLPQNWWLVAVVLAWR